MRELTKTETLYHKVRDYNMNKVAGFNAMNVCLLHRMIYEHDCNTLRIHECMCRTNDKCVMFCFTTILK